MKLISTHQPHVPQSSRFGCNELPARRRRSAVWFFCNGAVAQFLVFLAVLGGCNDPYSQRRIAMREEHLIQTATDIVDRERDGVRRVHEADEAAKKWWKRDVEDFERRAPTIGDYFW